MFLQSKTRKKYGKVHRTFSVVENRRLPDGRVAQRRVLSLGEINDVQHRAWRKTIEVVEGGAGKTSQMALFPEDRIAPPMPCEVVQVRWDSKSAATPLGQMAFFLEFLHLTGLYARWQRACEFLMTTPTGVNWLKPMPNRLAGVG